MTEDKNQEVELMSQDISLLNNSLKKTQKELLQVQEDLKKANEVVKTYSNSLLQTEAENNQLVKDNGFLKENV